MAEKVSEYPGTPILCPKFKLEAMHLSETSENIRLAVRQREDFPHFELAPERVLSKLLGQIGRPP